jgi:hypothetical protein
MLGKGKRNGQRIVTRSRFKLHRSIGSIIQDQQIGNWCLQRFLGLFRTKKVGA